MPTKKVGRTTKTVGRTTKKLGRRSARRSTGISRLFAGEALPAVLRVLFTAAPADFYGFYQRELAELAGQGLYPVQLALKRLLDAGVVERSMRAGRAYYTVNSKHPAFGDLRALILKTVGLGDHLRKVLRRFRFSGEITVAFIYGSVARQEDTPSSDVDLMLIGDASRRWLARSLAHLRGQLAREINATVYTPHELKQKYIEHHPFVKEVIDGPKVFLVGDEHELETILGTGSTQAPSNDPTPGR